MREYAEGNRKLHELRRSEMAEELGVSQRTICIWISEKRMIPESAIRQDDMGRYWIDERCADEVREKMRRRIADRSEAGTDASY